MGADDATSNVLLAAEVRRLKLLVMGMGVSVLAVGVIAAVGSSDLQPLVATEFRLIDGSGTTTARLYNASGGPALDFVDEGGDATMRLLQIGSETAGLLLYGGDGYSVQLDSDGVQIVDDRDIRRAALVMNPAAGGFPQLALLDQAGRVRVGIGVEEEGGAVIMMTDANGTPRAGMGQQAFLIQDISGRIIWRAP